MAGCAGLGVWVRQRAGGAPDASGEVAGSATPAPFARDLGERPVKALAPNKLARQFAASRPDERWVADLTYIWTAEGWLFLAVVLDLFSRRVVGWSMQSRMSAELVTDALVMALWRRRPGQRYCIIPTRVANTRVRCFSACWSCTGLNAV